MDLGDGRVIAIPPNGSLVALREGLDGWYAAAKAGWRARVRDHKIDDGFDLIYLEWEDKAQQDGWSYPAHFEVIEEPKDPDVCPDCGQHHEPIGEKRAQYLNRLTEAVDYAVRGDGFALFFLRERKLDNGEIEVKADLMSAGMDPASSALIEAKIVAAGQVCTDKFMMDYFRRINEQ